MALPLIPLVVEYLRKGDVESRSVGLIAGMWIIGLSVASDFLVVMLVGLLVGIVLAATLGVAEGQAGTVPAYPKLAIDLMIGFGIAFGLERAYKHLWRGTPCSPPEKE